MCGTGHGDVDFSNVEQMDESYKPNQAADRATSGRYRARKTRRPQLRAQGVPGALSTSHRFLRPRRSTARPALPTSVHLPGSSAHREQTTNFEVDKNVRHTKTASGEIRRLTPPSSINNKPAPPAASSPAAPGARPWRHPQRRPQCRGRRRRWTNIQALVREAMGFNEKRGDSLNVVKRAVQPARVAAVEPTPAWQQPETIGLAKEFGKLCCS